MVYINIVDEFGQPRQADLADILVEAIVPHVGFFRTEKSIEAAIRLGVSEVLRTNKVLPLQEHTRTCPRCSKLVTIWHTYTNGSVCCHACSRKPHE